MSEKNQQHSESNTRKDPLIVYVGDDAGFWASFKSDFKNDYKQLTVDFEIYFDQNPARLQDLAIKLITEKPRAIFFDLSKYPEEVLHLARMIARTNCIVKPALFGLLDITTDPKYMNNGMMAGIPIIHIKTSETEALVYDLVINCFYDALETHNFALAKMRDQVTAYFPAKVSSINANSKIRLETNYSVSPGSKYILHTHWSRAKIIASPLMKAESQTQRDLYYNFDNAQTLSFLFAAEVVDDPTIPPDKMLKRLQDRESIVSKSKLQLNEWIINHMTSSKPKPLKVLVVDKEHHFYKSQQKADEYPYVLRCQPYLKFPKKELMQMDPQLIIFNMEDLSTEELQANEDISYTYNETRTLQYLVKSIKSIENYNPYIVVFNNLGHDTARLQQALAYANIVSYKEQLSTDIVTKIAEILIKKLNAKGAVPSSELILDKSLPESYAEFELPITVLACSEMDMYFTSELELKEGTVLRLESPAPMLITVSKLPKNSKVTNAYYGLVNGIGEDVRMDLRKFINSVFFRSLEEQKKLERAEIEKLKKEAMEKIKQEEEAAAAAKQQAQAEAKQKKPS